MLYCSTVVALPVLAFLLWNIIFANDGFTIGYVFKLGKPLDQFLTIVIPPAAGTISGLLAWVRRRHDDFAESGADLSKS